MRKFTHYLQFHLMSAEFRPKGVVYECFEDFMRVHLKYFLNNQLEYIRERICDEVTAEFPPIDNYSDEFENSHIDDNGNEVFVM